MRVLMFGWEFPPHIAGGLGTACYGMTKGLAHAGVDVLFVMPSARDGLKSACRYSARFRKQGTEAFSPR